MLRRVFYLLFSALVLHMSVMCGSDEDAKDPSDAADTEDAGIPDGSVGSDDASDDASDDQPDENDAGDPGDEPRCGDNIVQEELNEVCDDGNLDDSDGCTSLCAYSCVDDSDCDDLNSCNGTETCNEDTNSCDRGEPLKDGEKCGDRKSCLSGLCRDDVCGDLLVQGDEQCDDGDRFNGNGCTTNCEYTCESDEDCTEGDTCAGSQTCNLEKHTCTGTPKENRESCIIADSDNPGWCIKGVCVPEKCGDGEKDDGEQCDKGSDNGEKDSGCSLVCKTVICGNGEIEEGEHCDDGNERDLDGCDSHCQAEYWVRWTKTNVVKDPSPDWCVHKGKNQMGNAFPGSIFADLEGQRNVELDVLSIINGMLNDAFDSCDSNALNLFSESDDLSFMTSDDDIRISVFDGQLEPDQVCNFPLDVDSRFSIIETEDDSPVALETTATQYPGVIKSSKPADIALQIPGVGKVILHDLMLLVELDTDKLSTPRSPPEMASSVQMPERMGFGETDSSAPTGRLCGALGTESMSTVGVSQESALVYCCNAQGEPYDECFEGDTPNVDCDSFKDVMEKGCMICDMAVLSGEPPSCDNCESFSLNIIYPTPPDIDTDDDDVPDSYSLLISGEGVRVRVTGVKEALE